MFRSLYICYCKAWIWEIPGFLRVPQIWALCGRFMQWPSAHAQNVRSVQGYADFMDDSPSWGIWCWMKNLPLHKEGLTCQDLKGQAVEMEVLLDWNNFCNGCTLLCLYYIGLLLIKVSIIFSRWEFALLFLVKFRRISFNPHFSRFLGTIRGMDSE